MPERVSFYAQTLKLTRDEIFSRLEAGKLALWNYLFFASPTSQTFFDRTNLYVSIWLKADDWTFDHSNGSSILSFGAVSVRHCPLPSEILSVVG
jgi:hypothetical protein